MKPTFQIIMSGRMTIEADTLKDAITEAVRALPDEFMLDTLITGGIPPLGIGMPPAPFEDL